MADDIPQWAKERAYKLLSNEDRPEVWEIGTFAQIEQSPGLTAFARYIAAHEEAPVDPLVGALQAIDGSYQSSAVVADILRKELAKRGLKIVEAE